MERLIKITYSGLLLAALLCSMILPAHALSIYTRGSKSTLNSQGPTRFRYADPFYHKRITQPKMECKAHGQARCLTPKKSTTSHIYTRQNPAMNETTVHPYLRKVFKPSIQRIN